MGSCTCLNMPALDRLSTSFNVQARSSGGFRIFFALIFAVPADGSGVLSGNVDQYGRPMISGPPNLHRKGVATVASKSWIEVRLRFQRHPRGGSHIPRAKDDPGRYVRHFKKYTKDQEMKYVLKKTKMARLWVGNHEANTCHSYRNIEIPFKM